MSQGLTKPIPLDTDQTLAADSEYIAPSQSAVKGYVDNRLSAANATDLTDGGETNLHTHAGGGYTDEQAQDAVGGILDNASVGDVAFTYDDTTPKISGVVKKSSQSFALTGIISPAALGSNQNNWNPTGLSDANVIYVTLSASINLTGLAGGADGRVIVIIRENDGFDLTLPYEDSNSTAANRFQYMDAGTAVVLGGHSICLLQYSSTLARWIVMQPGKTTEQIEDIVGAMVSSNTETGISVTYNDTDGKLNFDAQTAGDARYAPIAKGVTNGDSHNHVGGDGTALNYTDVIVGFWNSVNVPASTTYYGAPFKVGVDITGHQIPWAEGGVLSDMSVRISSNQPASGSLVITLQVNGVDTSLVVTIAAGTTGPVTTSDTTHTVNLSATDTIRWKVVNNATGASAALTSVTMKNTKQTT